ncbi:transcriptional regulator [uncultured Chryseobacterium sp.]|uniref:transcriptional regulator n=1 Tax=uncultured Chryseobacterium sp. TaxID=259322 RepID=UPI002615BFAE|nr:transcriptional regulator [uncultured Chryseobacterium sp.]
MSNTVEIDKEIFQDFANFYGKIYGLPPLAAKIYAFLIFDFEKEGMSFDELVEAFSASKSSVSSNLNFLLQINLIKDFNRIDERKRYFKLNEEYPRIRFGEVVKKMQTELNILDRFNQYRKERGYDFTEKYEIYTSLLKNNIENIENSLKKLYDEE